MTIGTHRLVVARLPEQLVVALMVYNVVNHGCLMPALDTQRMARQEPLAILAPRSSVVKLLVLRVSSP